MFPLLLVLFIAVPIAELAVIIQVGGWIGLWPTLAFLVADSILGSVLMRSQGRAAWRRFAEATQAGRPPAREVLDGVLVILGGALLLTPGFLTDLLGLLLLIPPTRAVIRRVLVRRLAHRMVVAMTTPGAAGAGPAGAWRSGRTAGSGGGGGTREGDVDGTATEIGAERLGPPPPGR